ncbi:hypothetical protein NDU88_000076 [Pleurodeles waltl]|uniref:Uncharacterized protein n=1 Tax=Pleurodeles waltl TaxID=8319 RepID=A0AAV7S3J3_PLEWA|nr:hypothetical protein NDU88_000076 [Pleurodeles waltl]
MGCPRSPRGPRRTVVSSRGPGNLLSRSGHQQSTHVQDSAALLLVRSGSKLQPLPPHPQGGRSSPTEAGVRRGHRASLQRSPGPTADCGSSPSSPAAPLNSSPPLQGRAPARAKDAPPPSHRRVLGDKFRLRHLTPGQAQIVLLDPGKSRLSGSRGKACWSRSFTRLTSWLGQPSTATFIT